MRKSEPERPPKTLYQGKKYAEHRETMLTQPFCNSTISNCDEFSLPTGGVWSPIAQSSK